MEENVDILIEMYNFLNKRMQIMLITENNNYSIINKMNELINLLEKEMREKCLHELEDDYIENNIDDYKKITYCKKCMLTF